MEDAHKLALELSVYIDGRDSLSASEKFYQCYHVSGLPAVPYLLLILMIRGALSHIGIPSVTLPRSHPVEFP